MIRYLLFSSLQKKNPPESDPEDFLVCCVCFY